MLAGDISGGHWLRAWLEDGQPVAQLGRLLLQPSAKAPQGFEARGKIVCQCFNVAQSEIEALLDSAGEADAMTLLQQKLKCGTSCGSCVPELKKIVVARVSALKQT
jgi:assimilatory nitrate reductase catalytic subunit